MSFFRSCATALAITIAVGGSAAFSQVSNAASPTSAPVPEVTHVIVPENTLIRVVTDRPLRTKKERDGEPVTFTVSEDVVIGHVLAIPRGSTVHGEVVENKKAGVVHGAPELTLKLDSLELGGKEYPLYAYEFMVQGVSRSKPTVRELAGGAAVGAIAGSVVAGTTNALPTRATQDEDMAAGAAAGAGAVAAAAVVGPRPVISLPAESQMDFYLASPISVEPVSSKEAERLGEKLHPGDPVLYVRGSTP